MQNTTMLYKFPGPHPLQDGGYDHVVVDDADIEEHLAKGWCKTPAEARALAEKPKETTLPKLVESQPPAPIAEPDDLLGDTDEVPPLSRAELEQHARDLGVEFRSSISDANLAARIQAKLNEKE